MLAWSEARPGNSSRPSRQEWPKPVIPWAIAVAMKPKARAAIPIQPPCPIEAPALASAAIISPFQSASTLSSRPGLIRFSRSFNSLPRNTAAGPPRSSSSPYCAANP